MRTPSRGELEAVLLRALDKAITMQTPLVRAHVERMQKRNPTWSRADLLSALEKQFLSAIALMGAAAGAAAAVPGSGTTVAVPANIGEVGGFIDATVLFVLALADVHDIEIDDLPRRRTLVLAIAMGGSGSKTVEKIAGRVGPHWARLIVKSIPLNKIIAINKVLGKNFVTKYGAKQGILVLGREIPFGIGAAIGAGGNLGLGYATVYAARRAFGPVDDDRPPTVAPTNGCPPP